MSSHFLLPTHSIASIKHPLRASGASHGLVPDDHPLLPASPRHAQLPGGANATWLVSCPQKLLQKQNSCPPPSTSLPQVPWEEAKEPPWLLILPAASPRSPHPTWGSTAPPCQCPHPGREAAPPRSFPQLSQEAGGGFPGRSIWGQSRSSTCYPSNQIPPAPPQAPGAQGEGGVETG